jgi:hypothetical protein
MDINSLKTDSKKEMEGVEYIFPDGAKVILKRFGGSNQVLCSQMMAKYHKPYARQLELGSLDPKTANGLMAKVLVESCMIGWSGFTEIQIGAEGSVDVEVPFTKEKAIKVFSEAPEECTKLLNFATDHNNYRVDLGNF